MNKFHLLSESWLLYRQVERDIVGYKRLLLSYSGGLDSTVLLDILTELKCSHQFLSSSFELRAIYVHHGLSRHAGKWAKHCYRQCKIRNVPFHVVYIDNHCKTYKNKKRNIEASARYFRYKKISDHLQSEEILLTAHHIDDQVETLFLALKRGSGPSGLASMKKIHIFHYNSSVFKLLRPLLGCTRDQLKKYADYKKLIWIEDHTNTNIRFDRNFLRIKVLPILSRRWIGFNQVVARTAQLCRNQENLLNELLSDFLDQLTDVDNALFFKPLFKCSFPKRHALLRLWLSKFFIIMPSYQLLHRIWTEVVLSRPDATPILRLDQHICRRFREKLYILPMNMFSNSNQIKLYWKNIHNVMFLPNHLGILICTQFVINTCAYHHVIQASLNDVLEIYYNLYKKPGVILTNCFVRSLRSDEKMSIHFGTHIDELLLIVNRNRSRRLKKIWQELNIPPWLRSRIPLIFYNDTLIVAMGVFLTQEGKMNFDLSSNVLLRITWLQDMLYYGFFQNSIKKLIK